MAPTRSVPDHQRSSLSKTSLALMGRDLSRPRPPLRTRSPHLTRAVRRPRYLTAPAIPLRTAPRWRPARSLAHCRLVRVERLEEAFAVSNAYAPEHLILALRDARAWLPQVAAAGSVFLGDHTPEALGDYCSGTNHVLPTNGAARAWSGVGVDSFRNFISVQEATAEGIGRIGPCAVTLAEAEGLEGHANAVRLRLERSA